MNCMQRRPLIYVGKKQGGMEHRRSVTNTFKNVMQRRPRKTVEL